jgi:hypothetical protein
MKNNSFIPFSRESEKSFSGGLLQSLSAGLLIMSVGFILFALLLFQELIMRALFVGGSSAIVCAGILWLIRKQKPRLAGIVRETSIGADSVPGFSIFFVKDNGAGIKPQYHERIFGLFNRLSPEVDGTGIGLTLAQRIIEVHGGRIWLESEEKNTGSTFYFTLPIAG